MADAFELGRPLRLARLQIGQIQQTWRLETTGGCYICQSLHPAFAEAVTEDAQAVSAYLRRQGFVIPEFLATRTGELHFEGEGGRWRVMTCLPGVSHRAAPDPAYLRQAGQAAGKMHRLLAGFEHRFRFQLPNFHNTPRSTGSCRRARATAKSKRSGPICSKAYRRCCCPPVCPGRSSTAI